VKELFFNRHAKSDWSNGSLNDFDRPLNKRGLRDSPKMAQRLLSRGEKIDVFLSSPANRAISTAKIIASGYGYPLNQIVQKRKLYLPQVMGFLESINEISEEHNSAIIFSHNPGITHIVEYLTDEYLGNIPTCGIAKVSFPEARSWNEISGSTGLLDFFDYPKREYTK